MRVRVTVDGKDGVPYPVNRKAIDESTEMIRTKIEDTKLGEKKKFRRYDD